MVTYFTSRCAKGLKKLGERPKLSHLGHLLVPAKYICGQELLDTHWLLFEPTGYYLKLGYFRRT